LVKKYDHEAADALIEDDLATMTAAGLSALARFIRFRDPARHETLLKRAVGLGPYGRGSTEAMAALIGSLQADSVEFESLLNQAASRGVFEAGRVAKLLEEDHRSTLAERLRKQAEAFKGSAPAVGAPRP
jgi:HPt (histidine-containing phosphotransfer) domain-containing protein